MESATIINFVDICGGIFWSNLLVGMTLKYIMKIINIIPFFKKTELKKNFEWVFSFDNWGYQK